MEDAGKRGSAQKRRGGIDSEAERVSTNSYLKRPSGHPWTPVQRGVSFLHGKGMND